MRLKSLELKGFKSFANDTLIHFNEPVIGIVGPNGSGKSNIVDAIRWVLGEQKGKELRLENMSDVIFNGTKKRKPSPVAQVALTFENNLGILPSEYHEVVISRHLYRSGESEYKLNGVTCRLKDIQSLLIDTGIGSNSYAIIALGMVDDILYDKDNARRKMFEQAAGVSKYKKRKHETMLKLKLTAEDLTRIEDILKEIQTNLEMLEKQAKRTQKFVELKQDYKTLSLNLAARNNTELRQQYADSETKIITETDTYGALEANLDLLHAEGEKLKALHLGDEQSVSQFQKELNEFVAGIRATEGEKSLAEQRISFLRTSIQNLTLQIEAADEKTKKLEAFHLDALEQFDIQKIIVEEQTKELENIRLYRDQVVQEFTTVLENRESVSQRQQEYDKAIFTLEKEMAVMQNNRDILHRDIELISEQSATASHEANAIEQQLSKEEIRKNTAAQNLASLEEEELNRQQNIREIENELTHQLDELRQIQRVLDARTHEADLLKDMISNLEGFPESIKFLSKSPEWDVTAPLLTDLIYCEPSFRIVVEQILEPFLNYYVVQSWEDAGKAIRLLSAAQKGRANFFILDEFNQAPNTVAPWEGATPIIDLVQIEAGYENLIRTVLANVFVTEGNPTQQLSPNTNVTVVDKSGQMIRRKGQLAGGSIGLFEGKKLGRKKHLEHIESEINEFKGKQHHTQGQVKELQARLADYQKRDHSQALKALRTEVVQLSQVFTELQTRRQHVQERIQENLAKQEKHQSQISLLEQQLNANSIALQEKKIHLAEFTATLEESEEKFQGTQQEVQKAEKQYNEAQLSALQFRNKLENIERELNYSKDQLGQLAENKKLQSQQFEKDTDALAEVEETVKFLQQKLFALYDDKQQKEAKLTEAEQQYYQQRNEISSLEEKIRQAEKQKSNQQYLINELKDSHHQLKFRLMAISERLEVEFGVRLEEIQGEVDETMDLAELEQKVLRLRNRIENYGEINPMAIEAHREIKERYDTINTQREDILNAKESLLTTIQEIESTATGQFLEAFDNVRENFIEVFRSLFSEDDSCDLILLDPEHPLESDIDIIAKPKGKRPKSLSQLSGGEKTLTAIALLFALYLLKPAPFCIFDEVDAPLDDANIQKFNRIIKKFSMQSQFIIVTHNKSTMAAVDTIYGVFMEEQGISGLSQVDFRAFDERDLLAVQN